MSLIHVVHLRKEYPKTTPLKDLSVDVDEGEAVSVIGPSGIGKSTLLRCLNRLEEPTAGMIVVDGENICDPRCDVPLVRRKMGMVFPSFNLFENLTALDNLCAAPVKLLHVPADEAQRQAWELLDRVGVADKATCFPDELSGGEQQRVAIARALAMRPKILLLDEPTFALDPTMDGEVHAVIRDLAREGMTMMIATHDMQFARSVSTRVLYLDDGRIYEDGTPQQIFEQPQREKTRQFIRHLKTLRLTVDRSTSNFASVIPFIERFGSAAGLSSRMLRNVSLVFEELVFQCVLPSLRAQTQNLPIDVLVEHAEADDSVSMRLAWDGPAFNPLEEGDVLSVAIVTRAADETSYAYEDGNVLTLTF